MKRLQKYESGGVTSVSGLSSAVGTPSAEVLLTGDKKKRKFIMDKNPVEKKDVLDAPEVGAKGIITTIDGKKLKITGLTDKEKDEYLFGDTEIQKAISLIDTLIDYYTAPELEENFDNIIEKCDRNKTFLIKGKIGTWRRIGGRPCFICKDGTIHAGPKAFVGKKASTLRDELRAERKSAKKSKAKTKKKA